jgi:hypothetical protein
MTQTTTFPQRFHRAVQMLSLAIAHVLSGNPDAARTNLRASWDDLKHDVVGRIEHMATAAYVAAVDGNVDYAVRVLGLTLDELRLRHYELPPVVRQWVRECCERTMEHLPYAATINAMVVRAYEHCHGGNHAEALYLLTRANDELKRVGHLIPPSTRGRVSLAWTNILERMLEDETTSALAFVREFSARYDQQVAA